MEPLNNSNDYGNSDQLTLPFTEIDEEIAPFIRDDEAIVAKRYAAIIRRLRGPGGCPWDRKQTLRSLRRYIIEESFELLAAIESSDPVHVGEELGDVTLVTQLIADALENESGIRLQDVLIENGNKLIRRHPHVFADTTVDSSEAVVANWNQIKKDQEGRSDSPSMAGIGLPPLERAYEVQRKAAKLGFDWNDPKPAIAKIREELSELEEELARADALNTPKNAKDDPGIEKELGDLMFSVVNVCRHLKTDPSVALARSNRVFLRRFSYIEETINDRGVDITDVSLEELDQLWNEAKQLERDR
jgi:tetrapyrrole methylase family protein/MazG family protein